MPELMDKTVICPKCYKPVAGYNIFKQETDEYGRKIRQYLGWCSDCQIGHEVVQFRSEDGKWHLHAYRYYASTAKVMAGPRDWQRVEPLPEPAPVVTGPGGDYRQAHHLDAPTVGLLKNLSDVLHSTAKSLRCLVKSMDPKNDGTDRVS